MNRRELILWSVSAAIVGYAREPALVTAEPLRDYEFKNVILSNFPRDGRVMTFTSDRWRFYEYIQLYPLGDEA